MNINQQFEEWWFSNNEGPEWPYLDEEDLARAAWNARLPEEHLKVVMGALNDLERESREHAASSPPSHARKYLGCADRYAATRRFLEGHDD